MAHDMRLESYLNALDRALGQIPVSDRAEIITEVKGQVITAMERDPKATVEQSLTALGPAEIIANRYLMARGLKPVPPPRSAMVKWLVIGFLGTMALLLFGIVGTIWWLSPIIEVNEKNHRVKIFGGLINVDDENMGKDWVWDNNGFQGSIDVRVNKNKSDLHGSKLLDLTKIEKIFIPFRQGKVRLKYNTTPEIAWNCQLKSGSDSFSMATEQAKVFTLDLDKSNISHCEISLPLGIKTVVNGVAGGLEIIKPNSALDVQMESGRVKIAEDKNQIYNFEVKVKNGRIGDFEPSDDPRAIRIKVELKNGVIERE